jgi:hypothetical protein
MARVISITWILVLCLFNCGGNRARSYFSRTLLLLSQGNESQMSGHADETVGEQQAGGVDCNSPPIPKGTIKYLNRILVGGREGKSFQIRLGRNWVYQ